MKAKFAGVLAVLCATGCIFTAGREDSADVGNGVDADVGNGADANVGNGADADAAATCDLDSRCDCPPDQMRDPRTGECTSGGQTPCQRAGFDCPSEASCVEEDEQPTCKCDIGYQGNGFDCERVVGNEWVRSVQHAVVRLPAGERSGVATIEQVDSANAVVFATMTATNVPNAPTDYQAEIWLTGPTEVRAEREGGGGTLDIQVDVVEFDPRFVRVQKGNFQMSGRTETVRIDEAVDLENTFSLFYYSADAEEGTRVNLTSEITETSLLEFTHDSPNTVLAVRWAVVEALSNEFAVNRLFFSIADGNERSGTLIVPPEADPQRSFRLVSPTRYTPGDDAAAAHHQITCALSDSGTMTCSRGGTDGAISVRAQVVTLLGEGQSVQRGFEDMGGSEDAITVSLGSPVDTSRSMPNSGIVGRLGATHTNLISSSETGSSFVAHTLIDSETLELNRWPANGGGTTIGDEPVAVDADWEVINW